MFLEKEEMKFTILYTLAMYSTPISMEDLAAILVWEKGILEYFDLQIMLAELIEDNFIEQKFHISETMYSLTNAGAETNDLFKDRVPKSIRDRIDDAVGSMKYETLVSPSSTVCEIVPINENQYMARLNIIDNKTPLIDFSIYIGERNEAERIVEKFKANPEKVYQKIVDIVFNGN